MKEAANGLKVKHLPPFLIWITQETMIPHLMTWHTWITVKEALISEFGSSPKLSKQKQAFITIQIQPIKLVFSFSKRLYWEEEFLVNFNKLNIDYTFAAVVLD